MATACTHLEHVLVTELPEEVDGCAECLAGGTPAQSSGHPHHPLDRAG